MKINTGQQRICNLTTKSFTPEKGMETGKDMVTLGQNKDDLGIMEKPVAQMKSYDNIDIVGDMVCGALELSLVGAVGFGARLIGGPAGAGIAGAAVAGLAGGAFYASEKEAIPAVTIGALLGGIVALGGLCPAAVPVLGAGMGLFNGIMEKRGEDRMIGLKVVVKPDPDDTNGIHKKIVKVSPKVF